MQRSNRGHFSSRIQKMLFITLKCPSHLKKKKKNIIKNKKNKKLLVCDPDQMKRYLTNIMSFSLGNGKLRPKKATFCQMHSIFYSSEGRQVWDQEALARPAAVSLLNQKFLRTRKEGTDSVTNSITSKGRSQWTSGEVLASSCHRRHGNEGAISASYLCFSVSLQTKSFTGNVSKCRTHVSLPILQ